MYLRRLYRHSPFAACILVFYLLGEAFFCYKGIENFPFFVYGMYSEPLQQKETYSITTLEIDGKEWSPYSGNLPAADFIGHNLQSYGRHYNYQFQDPIETTIRSRFLGWLSPNALHYTLHQLSNTGREADFLPWLARYIHQPMDSIALWRKTYQYTADKLVLTDAQRIAASRIYSE